MSNLLLTLLCERKLISQGIYINFDIDSLDPRDIIEWLKFNCELLVPLSDIIYFIERIYYIGVTVAHKMICKNGILSLKYVNPLSKIKIDSSNAFINKYLNFANIRNKALFLDILSKLKKSYSHYKIDNKNIMFCLKLKLHTDRLKCSPRKSIRIHIYYCVKCGKEEIDKDECLCDKCYRYVLVDHCSDECLREKSYRDVLTEPFSDEFYKKVEQNLNYGYGYRLF